MGAIALIDYGAGNLRSAEKALLAAGASRVVVTSRAADVEAADRVVLPGVGAFGAAMAALRRLPGMVDTLGEVVRHGGRPFLGICVGMQLMAEAGEEYGRHDGLGWVAGTVRQLKAPGVKIPHMGWNVVTPSPAPGAGSAAGSGAGLIRAGDAYFVHSYALDGADAGDVAALTEHGGPVVAAVCRANMLGVQFHPEKSQAYGLRLLERFLAWRP